MHATLEELLEAVFSVRFVRRLHMESICSRQLEASQELADEVGGCQLEVSPASEVISDGSTS
jgi:hypothetical protein